jgi:hypothetical protein
LSAIIFGRDQKNCSLLSNIFRCEAVKIIQCSDHLPDELKQRLDHFKVQISICERSKRAECWLAAQGRIRQDSSDARANFDAFGLIRAILADLEI